MTRSTSLALALVAGAACSVSLAQQSDVYSGSKGKPTALKHKSRALRSSATVNPVKVEIDGVQVPFTLADPNGATDSQFLLYDNRGATDNFTSNTHRHRTLDDFAIAD